MSNPDWYVDVNIEEQEDYGDSNEDQTPDPYGWDDSNSIEDDE